MKYLKIIYCYLKTKSQHNYKYTVKQEGDSVIAKKECKDCGFFVIKIDDGT